MSMIKGALLVASIFSVPVLVCPATAQTTYTNQSGAFGYFNYFGAGHPYDVPTLGQVFTAPSGTLQSWTFYDDSAAASGATFAVAAWNGSTATGANLFSAASNTVSADPYSSGFYAHTVSGINLALTAGQSYYAYYTTYGAASPVVMVSVEDTSTSPLGGYAAFSSSAGNPVGAAYIKYNTSDNPLSVVYTATFDAATTPAVPEPATWAMMILGMGAVGFALRRSKVATRVCYAA